MRFRFIKVLEEWLDNHSGGFKGLSEAIQQINEQREGKRRTVDRRKLSRLLQGEDVSLSVVEFETLNAFLTHEGASLSLHPLFESPSVFLQLAAASRVCCFQSVRPVSRTDETAATLADELTVLQLSHALQRQTRGQAEVQVIPIPEDESVVLDNFDPACVWCAVGSLESSPVSEQLAAGFCRVPPYAADYAVEVPFRIFSEERRPHSSFSADPKQFRRRKGEPAPAPALCYREEVLPVRLADAEHHDYGVLLASLTAEGQLRLVITGVTGLGQRAASTALIQMPEQISVTERQVSLTIIQAEIHNPIPDNPQTRQLQDWRILDRQSWPTPGGGT